MISFQVFLIGLQDDGKPPFLNNKHVNNNNNKMAASAFLS